MVVKTEQLGMLGAFTAFTTLAVLGPIAIPIILIGIFFFWLIFVDGSELTEEEKEAILAKYKKDHE